MVVPKLLPLVGKETTCLVFLGVDCSEVKNCSVGIVIVCVCVEGWFLFVRTTGLVVEFTG